MSWLKVDDLIADDADEVGDAALGALVRLGAFSARHLTDGRLSRTQVAKVLGDDPLGLLAQLVAAEYVKEVPGGYEITTTLVNIRPREDVLEDRAKGAARQEKWREKRRNAVTSPVGHGVSNGVTDGVSNGVTNAVTTRSTDGDGDRGGHSVTPLQTPLVTGAPSRPDLPTEDKEPTHTPRARDGGETRIEYDDDGPRRVVAARLDRKTLEERWRIQASVPGQFFPGVLELAEQVEAAAAQAGMDSGRLFDQAIAEFKAWRDTCSPAMRPQLAPRKLLEHWADVWERLTGAVPAISALPRGSPSRPKRAGGRAAVAAWEGVAGGEER